MIKLKPRVDRSDQIEARIRAGMSLAEAVAAVEGTDVAKPKTTAAKARGAGAGGGLGAALTAIIVWGGAQAGLDMGAIETPLAIVLSAVLAYVGAYFPTNREIVG